ncbi:hypothetical protein GF407_10495 [candidate division KSB1 bacterium]|nr:hypothetical protein [candidate division KSB1 bacterium]
MRLLIVFLVFVHCNLFAQPVSDYFKDVRAVYVLEASPPVVESAVRVLFPKMKSDAVRSVEKCTLQGEGTLTIGVVDSNSGEGPFSSQNGDDDSFFIRLTAENGAIVAASDASLLYTAACRLAQQWQSREASYFRKGRHFFPSFKWLEGADGFFAARKFFSRGYNPEENVREMARIGCTHIGVNALATPFAYEQGPPGEHYYRFYITNPDLDQFVETELNKETYPPEYLAANMNRMQKNIELAEKHGLAAGLNLCSPRSVPESFFQKYPQLRGARIDHPFHSYKPRYTMTLAHPAVRWHYAEMMKKIMQRFPQLSWAYIWSNDSGSGFEHTMTTYPGRNGGAFLVREWRTNEQIAEKAGMNILRYLKGLRDAARRSRPDFDVILRLFSFPAAEDYILKHLEEGIDLRLFLSDRSDNEKWTKFAVAREKGSDFSYTNSISMPYSHVAGVPFPWQTQKRLQEMLDLGIERLTLSLHPFSLAPYDINREVLGGFQFHPQQSVDSLVLETAKRWVGEKEAEPLVAAWKLVDKTVETFPSVPLYAGYGFVSFRLWVRPLVPDIEKIPQEKRAYYEKFMLSNYYNPNLVDLSKNALWTLVPQETAEKIVEQYRLDGYDDLKQAISLLECDDIDNNDRVKAVFTDQRDRLKALLCYHRSLENTCKWIVGVHGYMQAETKEVKNRHAEMIRDMMRDEIDNCRELKTLYTSSSVPFTPISAIGENWYTYGENLDQLLQKKIDLMKAHMEDEPFIEDDFMWNLPATFNVSPEIYLNY